MTLSPRFETHFQEDVMGIKVTNSPMKIQVSQKSLKIDKEQIVEFAKNPQERASGATEQEIRYDYDEDYYKKINLVSFKRSFSKLQQNYRLEH
jgi:hypothetical protein